MHLSTQSGNGITENFVTLFLGFISPEKLELHAARFLSDRHLGLWKTVRLVLSVTFAARVAEILGLGRREVSELNLVLSVRDNRVLNSPTG